MREKFSRWLIRALQKMWSKSLGKKKLRVEKKTTSGGSRRISEIGSFMVLYFLCKSAKGLRSPSVKMVTSFLFGPLVYCDSAGQKNSIQTFIDKDRL